MKKQFEHYRVGDEVWSFYSNKFLKIVQIEKRETNYPIGLENGQWITLEGQLDRTGSPDYFCQPFEIPHIAFEKPMPRLALDAKVLVRDSEEDAWIPRHFRNWDGEYCRVWDDGQTSFTTKFQQSHCYKFWQLLENHTEFLTSDDKKD